MVLTTPFFLVVAKFLRKYPQIHRRLAIGWYIFRQEDCVMWCMFELWFECRFLLQQLRGSKRRKSSKICANAKLALYSNSKAEKEANG